MFYCKSTINLCPWVSNLGVVQKEQVILIFLLVSAKGARVSRGWQRKTGFDEN